MSSPYPELAEQLQALLGPECDLIANAANCAAFIFHQVPGLNWAGFYLLHDNELVVGPFQGKPACVRIAMGAGVCGVAAQTRQTQRVADVHAFDGHIACDPDSRSELVVPLVQGPHLIGVLDLDSDRPGRFTEQDQVGIERLAQVFVKSLKTAD